jgi:hypothetical protein
MSREGGRMGRKEETERMGEKKKAVQCYVQCYLKYGLLFTNKSYFIMHKPSTK